MVQPWSLRIERGSSRLKRIQGGKTELITFVILIWLSLWRRDISIYLSLVWNYATVGIWKFGTT